MLSFCLDVSAGCDRRKVGRTWFAALLAALFFLAAHGTARADRTLPDGTVGTAYSQSATVYTDPTRCTPEWITNGVSGLTATDTSVPLSPTCSFTVNGTPTAAGNFTLVYRFMPGSGTVPSDAQYATFYYITYDITIAKASPTLSVSASPSSVAYTGSLTLTATLGNAFSPTGTVTFYDNGTSIGTASLSGTTANLTISTLSVGSHAITASYGGDSNHDAATTTGAATVMVTQTTPSIALNTSASSASYGSSVALVATVSGAGSPTGTVTFYEGATNLGTSTLSGATAILMVSSLSLGAHTITAVYNGDTNNASVTSSATTVTIVQYAPTVTLSASATSIAAGGSVTLVATISGGLSPTGTVTFYDGATSLGSGTVSGSTALLTVASLSGGSHSIKAVYGGDSNNATATSSTITVTAGKATPAISVSSSTASPAAAQSVTLTATLSGGSSPTGTVTFKDGATVLGTGTVSASVATLATSALAMGTHSVTAVYAGDSNNAGATSSAIILSVGRSDPTSNATVRGLTSSQVSSAIQFGQTQIANIFVRFEALHDEDDGGAGGGRQAAQGGTGPGNSTSAGGMSGGDGRTASLSNSQTSTALGYANDSTLR